MFLAKTVLLDVSCSTSPSIEIADLTKEELGFNLSHIRSLPDTSKTSRHFFPQSFVNDLSSLSLNLNSATSVRISIMASLFKTAARPSALRAAAGYNAIRTIGTADRTFVRTKATLPDLKCMSSAQTARTQS